MGTYTLITGAATLKVAVYGGKEVISTATLVANLKGDRPFVEAIGPDLAQLISLADFPQWEIFVPSEVPGASGIRPISHVVCTICGELGQIVGTCDGSYHRGKSVRIVPGRSTSYRFTAHGLSCGHVLASNGWRCFQSATS